MENILIFHLILLFIMIFIHIMLDFHQGDTIASMKQKDWWLNHPEYKKEYENDYKVVLLVHGFSWSFAIQIPMIIYQLSSPTSQEQDEFVLAIMVLIILINTALHAFVDDMKANKKCINLKDDQTVHIIQIIIAWAVSMWSTFQ